MTGDMLSPATAKRVMFVTTSLDQGGAEHQVVLLATHLARRGWDVRVVSLRPVGVLAAPLRQAGIPVTSLDMPRRVPDVRGIVRLARLIRRKRPDVVHGHMIHANLLARVTSRFAPTPVLISTAHNVKEGPRWMELMLRATDSLCDLSTNVSQAAVDRYIRVGAAPAGRIRHVPNGIDLTRFSLAPSSRSRHRQELGAEGQTVLLTVGRLEEAKDHANLLQALPSVIARHPHVLLLIVGQGELEVDLRRQVREAHLDRYVRFLGARDDVPALMNAADLFVLPSAWEGLPLVLLEAGAARLPVVATDVGGNAEAVLHGVSGRLVPPHDPEALAAAIADVLSMGDVEREAWGAAGHAHVRERYSVEQVVSEWEGLYASAWSQSVRRPRGRAHSNGEQPISKAREGEPHA